MPKYLRRHRPFLIALVIGAAAAACASQASDVATLRDPTAGRILSDSACGDSVLAITALDTAFHVHVPQDSDFTLRFHVTNTSGTISCYTNVTTFAVPKGTHITRKSPFQDPASSFLLMAGHQVTATGYFGGAGDDPGNAVMGMEVGSGAHTAANNIVVDPTPP